MIVVDDRVGSRELMRYLPPGSAVLSRQQFGDVAFVGNGPEGAPVNIGIEIKRLDDMLASMVDGRFAGYQLPGLLRDHHLVYIVLEGHWRPDPETDVLQIFKGRQWVDLELGTKRWTARHLNGFLTTIETRYGVRLRRTFNRRETAALILDLHHWWTDKEYEDHRSAQALNFSGEPLLPISTLRRIAAQLPKIGWKRSGAVADHFSSVIRMVLAPEKEWCQIDGIGKTIAAGVINELWKERVPP